MDSKISLAWAVSANYAQLGARLEAYVETKPTITTFRACLPRSPIPSVSNIPLEVIETIEGALKDMAYFPKVRDWLKDCKCIRNECGFRDHFPDDDDVSIDSEDDITWGERCERHQEIIDDHVHKVTHPASDPIVGKFARCKEVSHYARFLAGLCSCSEANGAWTTQVFAKDFGVRPYFTVLPSYTYHDFYAEFESAEIFAYLARPIVKAPVTSQPGPNNASYTVRQVLDPARVRRGLSKINERQFKRAVKALRLEAAHTSVTVEIDRDGQRRMDCEGRCRRCGYCHNVGSDEEPDDAEEGNEMEQGEGEQEEGNEEQDGKEEDGEDGNEEDGEDGNEEDGEDEEETAHHHAGVSQKPLIEYKTHCIDCGSEECQGSFKVQKPELMFLGSGELETYNVEE